MKKIIVILLLLITLNVKAISINDYSNGIDGRIIQKSIIAKLNQENNEESIIISSKEGIYIKTGDNYRYIKANFLVSVIVIDDINNDFIKDIVYASNTNNGEYNIVAVSGKDETILWTNTLTEKKFYYDRLFNNSNITINKIEQVDKKIVVISDYSLYVLDIKTGKLSFKYKDKDNIWDVTEVKDINNNLNNEIALSNQLGEVKLIDSKTGKIFWSKKVLEDLSFKSKIPVTRNIWQVEFYKDDLYALGEDGTLFLIDYKTGNIKDKLVLDEFNNKDLEDYYIKSMSYSFNKLYPSNTTSEFYKNYEIFFHDDYILVSRFFNALERNTEINNKYKPKVYKIKDFKIVNEIDLDDISLFNVEPIEINNNLYVPIEIKDNNLIVSKYDYNTKEVDRIKLYFSNYINGETKNKIYLNKIKDNILLEQLNTASFLLNGDFNKIIENNNSYSTSNIVKSNNDELLVSYKSNNINYKIEYYDNLNSFDPKWEYNITKDFNNNGLFSISMEQDYNKDGKKDVTALINKVNNNDQVIATYILILNSKDGSILKLKNIHTGTYYDNGKRIDMYLIGSNLIPIKDVNGDGISEFILDNTVINGNIITPIGMFNMSVNTTSSRILSLGDINKDSIKDIIAIEKDKATIYMSNILGNNINYIKTNNNIKYSKDLLNDTSATLIPDLNNDGIKELVFNDTDNNKKQIFKVYSGKDLSYMFSIDDLPAYELSFPYAFLNDDLNNDGYNDFYYTKSGAIYKFISGKDGSTLYEVNLYPENKTRWDVLNDSKTNPDLITVFNYDETEHSATVGIDLNKDSKKEIFILKEEYYPDSKLILYAYDITNNKSPIRSFEIYYDQNNNFSPDIYKENQLTNYIKEVVNSDGLFMIKTSQYINTTIYDAKSNKTLSEVNATLFKSLKTSNNNIFGVTSNNNPIYINFDNDFKITNIDENKSYKSPIDIKINSSPIDDLRIVRIYNKDVLLDTKYSDNFTLNLRKGNQDLVFKSYDRWGKTQNYNLKIKVNKFNPYILIFSIVSILFILIIVYISIGYRIKRKKSIRRIYG